MTYFHIRRVSGRANQLVLRSKAHFFANKAKETYVKKTQSIAIYGGFGSGKSHKINQLKTSARSIWSRSPIIFIRATDSLSDIFNRNLKSQKQLKIAAIDDDSEVLDLETLEKSA
jgi:DNA replication protein DnaC